MATRFIPSDPLFPLQWHLHNTGTVKGAVAGFDINVLPVWPDYTGKGRLVGIFDEGMDETHPDLVANYRADLGWDFIDDRPGGQARADLDNHGVAVAGLIAASAHNDIGGVGVAWDAQFTMHYFKLRDVDESLYEAFWRSSEKMVAQGIEIANHSWGPGVPFYVDGSDQQEVHGIGRYLANTGREGLGMVVTFSAGNERLDGMNTNYDASTTMPWVIVVGASDQSGGMAVYSTPGANVLISAPGSMPASIVSTDRQGTDGYNTKPGTAGDYTNTEESYFNGTSAASPIAAGVVALMLEANSGLGYRDVQEILAYSARRATFLDRDHQKAYNGAHDWNGGALLVSHNFGFGHIDAHAAVRLAESWHKVSTLANLVIEDGEVAQRELTVEAGEQATVTADFSADNRVEHMLVHVDLEAEQLGQVTLELISPDGTASWLLYEPKPYVDDDDGEVYPLPVDLEFTHSTVQNWGEDLAGTWTLRLSNGEEGDTVHLKNWSIQAFTAGQVGSDGVQIFTDEFARFVDEEAERTVLDAANGRTLNAAAVTSDVVFDLSGGVSAIGETEIHLADPGAFSHLVSGDGNDILIGNEADNILMPGRGYNHVDGGAGLDVLRLIGESGNYSVNAHGEMLAVHSHALWNGGVDYVHGVELLHFADRVMLTHVPELHGPDLFDEASYLLQNPDVAQAVAAGWLGSGRQHYEQWGESEGRNPNSLFSEAWYLAQYADVAQAVEEGAVSSGFAHYSQWGWTEGRAPSTWMNTAEYLQAYPDVEAAGVEPLQHYLMYGIHEGRMINALNVDAWI